MPDQFECKCVTINNMMLSLLSLPLNLGPNYTLLRGARGLHCGLLFPLNIWWTRSANICLLFHSAEINCFLLSPVNCRSGRAENCEWRQVENVLAIIFGWKNNSGKLPTTKNVNTDEQIRMYAKVNTAAAKCSLWSSLLMPTSFSLFFISASFVLPSFRWKHIFRLMKLKAFPSTLKSVHYTQHIPMAFPLLTPPSNVMGVGKRMIIGHEWTTIFISYNFLYFFPRWSKTENLWHENLKLITLTILCVLPQSRLQRCSKDDLVRGS